jgi:anti-sigma factor RsiW
MRHEASHEHFEALLVKAVDRCLTAGEREELEAHLTSCPSCRAELDDFRVIKDATDAICRQVAPGAGIALSPLRRRPLPPAVAVGAVSLLSVALVLLSYGVYGVMVERSMPLHVKAGSGFLGLGVLLALGLVLRRR